MDYTEAQATLARITPPPLTQLSLDEVDDPRRAVLDAFLEAGKLITGGDLPPGVLAAADQIRGKAVQLTATQQQVVRNDDGQLAPVTLVSEGFVRLEEMGSEEFIDMVALLLINLDQLYFRAHYEVDGKLLYGMDETGDMAWTAFQAYAANHPMSAPRVTVKGTE